MKRRIVLLCASILGLTFVVSGCGKKKRQQNQELNSSITDTVASESSSDSFDKSFEVNSAPEDKIYSTSPEKLGSDYSVPSRSKKAIDNSEDSGLKLNKKPPVVGKKVSPAKSSGASTRDFAVNNGPSKSGGTTTQKTPAKSASQKPQPKSVNPTSKDTEDLKKLLDSYLENREKEKSSKVQPSSSAIQPQTVPAAPTPNPTSSTSAPTGTSQSVIVVGEAKNANPASAAAQ